MNGELIKARLGIEGIPVLLKFETYFNLALGAFCPVRVLVPRHRAEKARRCIDVSDQRLVPSIPAKNRWTFIVFRLLVLFFH